ncbi:hypothetical protein R70006_06254 [Paraburkholderia domus]|uniref:hypothetical protein n=1 Tax=Paraburkholderia domus TaxID=2793075 RepID=UPI0019131596|nr:hypothetical protein [Paraburkholderia domus]MBK5052886.1 hypothetical protein [Burkholderia sp. R-70006]CAE6822175.1 hypothetical protein R70006_06254 [Paraburkholderia domus]
MTSKTDRSEEVDGMFAGSATPRVDAVIRKTMERFPGLGPGSQMRYYEAVHQELTPLARTIETETVALHGEIVDLRAQIARGWRAGAVVGTSRAEEDTAVIKSLSVALAEIALTLDVKIEGRQYLDLPRLVRERMLELELYRSQVMKDGH